MDLVGFASRFMQKVQIGWESHFYIAAYQMDISMDFFVCLFLALKNRAQLKELIYYQTLHNFFPLVVLHLKASDRARERERQMKRNELKHLNKWRKLSLGVCVFFTRWLHERKPLDYGRFFPFFGPSLSTGMKWFVGADFFYSVFISASNRMNSLLLLEKMLPFSSGKYFNAKCHVSHLIIIKSL